MKLLIDEMYSAAIAATLRANDVDAVAVQEILELRGLPDPQLFVHAQLERRCIVTENIADFVVIESAWRAEQPHAHHGLVLVSSRSFPRHRRGAIGQLARAILTVVTSGRPAPGTVVWLETPT